MSALIEKNIGVMNIKNAFIKQELEGIVFNPVTIWGLDPASLDEILGQMIGKTIIRN